MRIYILRHGIAEEGGPRTPDSKRELTDEGRRKLAAVLKLARRAGVQPELVISSPLVRAVQTAEMAREILHVEAALQQSRTLVPEGSPHGVWEELSGLRNLDEVLLAGHEPLLEFVDWMAAGGNGTAGAHGESYPGVRRDREFSGEPQGILRWMVHPKLTE